MKYQCLYDYEGELPNCMMVYRSDWSWYSVLHKGSDGLYHDQFHYMGFEDPLSVETMMDMDMIFFHALPDELHTAWKEES